MKVLITLVLVVVLVAAGGGWWFWHGQSTPQGQFRTVAVERGDLLATINATGTIEPEEVIDVGAQVAGQILSFGRDPRDTSRAIDYGSPVEKDTVLARIDEALYRADVESNKAQVDAAAAQVEQNKADVEQAVANVTRAEADLEQMKAKLYQADRDWTRAQSLGRTRGVISDLDYDTSQATFKTSQATVAVGEAAIAQAKAGLGDAKAVEKKAEANLALAKAALGRAETNLGYCTIKSPVKGVIIDRRVNVGQTVVSSLNAPSLFLIAKDLKRLQVWASVNEADIGNIHSGQAVTFSVDAYPGQVFRGVVAPDQPRLNASMTQNVVTYTVVVNTDNSDGKLKPYLTANLEFEVSKHTNALLVPNAALRWRPNAQQVAPEARDDFVKAQRKRGGEPGDKPASPEKERTEKGMLWVEDNGFVRPVKVHIGLSDGVNTEIVGGDLTEGAAVVVGEVHANSGTGGTTNPFTPQMFGGGKKQ